MKFLLLNDVDKSGRFGGRRAGDWSTPGPALGPLETQNAGLGADAEAAWPGIPSSLFR